MTGTIHPAHNSIIKLESLLQTRPFYVSLTIIRNGCFFNPFLSLIVKYDRSGFTDAIYGVVQLWIVFIISTISLCTTRKYGVPYSGKLSREKTFMNFEILCLWLFTKVFSAKFGDMAASVGSTNCESFSPRKLYFWKFSLSNVFCYTVFVRNMEADGMQDFASCIHGPHQNMSIPLLHLGTIGFILWTSLHIETQHVRLVVPDMNSCVTCSYKNCLLWILHSCKASEMTAIHLRELGKLMDWNS